MSSRSVLHGAGQIRVTRAGPRDRGPVGTGGALGHRRFHVHRLLPVHPVAIADEHGDGRARRASAPDAGQHLDLVALDLHAAAATVAALPSLELRVDGGDVEGQARGNTVERHDERLAVRLAGGEKSQHPHLDSIRRNCPVLAAVRGVVRRSHASRRLQRKRRVSPLRANPAPTSHAGAALRAADEADALSRKGRHAAAERALRQLAGALVRRRAFAPASAALIRLGRLLGERGRSSAACRAFETAEMVAHDGRIAEARAAAAIWLTTAYADNGQLAEAEARCRDHRRHLDLPPDLRRWSAAVLGRICLWQGRIDEARAVLEECAPAVATDEHAAYVEATAVRVLVALGDLFGARRRLDAAEDAAATPVMRLLLDTAALRLACAGGDLEAAAAALTRIGRGAAAARLPLRVVRAQVISAAGAPAGGPADRGRAGRTPSGAAAPRGAAAAAGIDRRRRFLPRRGASAAAGRRRAGCVPDRRPG